MKELMKLEGIQKLNRKEQIKISGGKKHVVVVCNNGNEFNVNHSGYNPQNIVQNHGGFNHQYVEDDKKVPTTEQ